MKSLLFVLHLGALCGSEKNVTPASPPRGRLVLLSGLACALALSLLSVTTDVSAKNIGLVLAISDYPRQPLPGVQRDIDHAIKIAAAFGVQRADLEIRRDRELTREGLLAITDSFARKVSSGDRVFVYFSGHGTSYASNGTCNQALVAVDTQRVTREEFANRLKPAFAKASKSLMFIDSCFSGGVIEAVASRALPDSDGDAPVAKFWIGKSTDSCAIASNVARGQRDFEAVAAPPGNQFYLAAASGTEEAIDGGRKVGGFATASVASCLEKASSIDADGDGLTSWSEVATCAQGEVDRMIAAGKRGPNFPFVRQTLTSAFGAGGDSVITPLVSVAASLGGGPGSSAALLSTIQRMADSRRQVTVSASQPTFRIGSDYLSLSVGSAAPGYVVVLALGSSGAIVQLFPNQFDRANRIEAGQVMQLPRDAWRLRSKGPAGSTQVVVLVSDHPVSFADLAQPAGPFHSIRSTEQVAQQIAERITGLSQGCRDGVKARERDFEVVDGGCATSYGVASVQLVETK